AAHASRSHAGSEPRHIGLGLRRAFGPHADGADPQEPEEAASERPDEQEEDPRQLAHGLALLVPRVRIHGALPISGDATTGDAYSGSVQTISSIGSCIQPKTLSGRTTPWGSTI